MPLRSQKVGVAIGIAVGVLLALAVFAIVLVTSRENDKNARSPVRSHVYLLRSGDTVRDPRTRTKCEATAEAEIPNLYCTHPSGAGEAVFWSDALQVYGPGSSEMTPTYSFAWWGGTRCAPPRGPNDRNIHSTHLVVHGVSCAAGRAHALTCARFSYGRSGRCRVSGANWFCSSVRRSGSESDEICAFARKSVSITWTD
jgi:hypothetical protein